MDPSRVLLTASEECFQSKHEKDKRMRSDLWTYFEEVLPVAYSEPFTRKITCTEKAPARKNEPILFSNIYTFTQRKNTPGLPNQ